MTHRVDRVTRCEASPTLGEHRPLHQSGEPGTDPVGHEIPRKVSGKTKATVADRLPQLHRDLDAGARPAPSNHTVRQVAEDWLAHGLRGRSAKTICKN